MSSSKFVVDLAVMNESPNFSTYHKDDPHDGSLWMLLHKSEQKVIASVQHNFDPISIMNQRVEGQNTMNCLSMQSMDMKEPFNDIDVFHPDVPKKVREKFEDAVQAVYDTHHHLVCNNRVLWSSQILMVCNGIKVRNVYVNRAHMEESKWEQKIESIILTAHITTASFIDVFDTYKYPDMFWDIELDSEYGRIKRAKRLEFSPKCKVDMEIKSEQSENSAKQYPISNIPSNAIMDAWNIRHVTGKSQSSDPGRVNTVRSFRCVDHLDRTFNLSIRYNM